jgi:hypothetical protein
LRRFEAERRSPDKLRQTVDAFVAWGNRLSSWDIAAVEVSPFALDLALLRQIRGETSMGWTAFDAILADGRRLSMGTTFFFEFFELPEGITAKDVVRIQQVGTSPVPGRQYIPPPDGNNVFREKPFFTCYLEEL